MAIPRLARGRLCGRASGGAAAACVALLAASSAAQRPSEGGLWAYSEDDILAFYDTASGRVRVHYAIEGPSQTLLDDHDDDGVPDFAAEVAETADASLVLFAELGFRAPLTEEELGLGPLGGSSALDLYLVDFQGNADGSYGVDACIGDPPHCGGWLGVENDFSGYSYSDLTEAVETVVPHEVFHAVQSAYHGGQPVWFSEGSAVWAQRMFSPTSDDFLGKCDAYLALSERPIYAPPAGPVQAFSYGTALFWWFLHERLGGGVDVDLQLASEASDGSDEGLISEIDAAITAAGESTPELWSTFVQFNLATGPRAGALDGHAFAAELGGIEADSEGTMIDDMARLSPLAASYYHLHHQGGEMAFALDEPLPEVRFSLHPVVGGALDGPVEPAALEWEGSAEGEGLRSVGDRPEGGYWLVASLPEPLAATAKARLCFGPASAVEECAGEEPGGSETEGGSTGDDSETDASSGGDDSATWTGSGAESDGGDGEVEGEGCACALGGSPQPWRSGALIVLVMFRRRPRRRSTQACRSASVDR